ncbi:MAG TPA: DUF4173 domain-containing protein [Bradyrhizobium sp.]|nr:DUF4173 domain-containing protein [Bradyrhizobium sp.]
MSIATASDFEIAPTRPLLRPLISATACVALADWLFYGWQIGISLALFFGVLGVIAVASNRGRATRTIQIIMSAVLVAGLLPLIEDVSTLSVIVSALATALFVIVVTTRETLSWQRNLFEAVIAPFRGPFQLAGDLFGALRLRKRQTPEWLSLGSLIGWIVPLSVFMIFLALFSSGNPLIEYRLMQIDLRVLFNVLDLQRMAFWLLVLCAIWPLILRRIRSIPNQASESSSTVATEPSDFDYLFGVQAMLRSLVLFNALFALQTGLDLVYLWGGATLPDGMSHAEYAHRGAYPLIVTALLAAGFVLIAMRPGGPAEQSRLIRPLVLVWTGQNVLLVVSSILRLDLYVAAFSLTYLRLAALIWMVLVAAGLLLMLIQIMLKKPNSWLVTANAATLALVLYGCCFLNAPWVVASYNIEHSRELGGTGPSLDLIYLAGLGPQALPALEAHIKQIPALGPIAQDRRNCRGHALSLHPANWRGWSFRAWRLERYFSNNPSMPS